LTPWESFTKDVVLLVLILILFLGKSYIKPIFNPFLTTLFALLSFIASLAFGNHVLMHLPSIDFRAYKIGNNLIKNMSTPEDAPKAIQEFTWVFNVNGEEKTIITDGSYPTIEGDYVSVETEVIDEGYQPSILDFSIESEDEDLTDVFLAEDKLIMIVSYNLDTAEKEGLQKLKSLSQKAQSKGYTVIGLSASGKNAIANINKTYDLGFEFYLCDEKALKTVVRSNPGVLELNQGTVQQKVHWNDIDNLDL
jgi:peroxiredoxin